MWVVPLGSCPRLEPLDISDERTAVEVGSPSSWHRRESYDNSGHVDLDTHHFRSRWRRAPAERMLDRCPWRIGAVGDSRISGHTDSKPGCHGEMTCEALSAPSSFGFNAFNEFRKGDIDVDARNQLLVDASNAYREVPVEPESRLETGVQAMVAYIDASVPAPDGAIFDPSTDVYANLSATLGALCSEAGTELVIDAASGGLSRAHGFRSKTALTERTSTDCGIGTVRLNRRSQTVHWVTTVLEQPRSASRYHWVLSPGIGILATSWCSAPAPRSPRDAREPIRELWVR